MNKIDANTAAEMENRDKLADAKRQGQAQFDSIKKMVADLIRIRADTERHGDRFREDGVSLEDVERRIHEDVLSIKVRSDWIAIGDYDRAHADLLKPAEYKILLCTGGPAVQIVGTLSEHCEPETAEFQVKDWFQPWTAVRTQVGPDNFDSEPILLEYARQFYFGG